MTYDDERDRELDAWLRQPLERLAPPDGSFERVSTRARRRKWAKAVAGTAAGVVIVAGAFPAVIAVRHNANNQKLTAGASSSPAPSPSTSKTKPARPSGLNGFFPLSVSFVSSDTGYAWGSVLNSNRGVVAKTTDQGRTWKRLSTAPVAAALNSGTGDGQIRMVSGVVGYIFGPKLFVTKDSGRHWTQLASPGYVDDLEAGGQRAWALVRPSQTSTSVQLYRSSAADPSLKKVSDVHGIAPSGTDSIAVNLYNINKQGKKYYSTDVLIGSYALWQANNGANWTPLRLPCPPRIHSGAQLQSALIAASGTSATTLAAACGWGETGNVQSKGIVTLGKDKAWHRTSMSPSKTGYLETLTMGPQGTIIIGTSGGGAHVLDLNAEGQPSNAWKADNAGDAGSVTLGFVGFIGTTTVVALQDPTSHGKGAFAVSQDSGQTWATYPFP